MYRDAFRQIRDTGCTNRVERWVRDENIVGYFRHDLGFTELGDGQPTGAGRELHSSNSLRFMRFRMGTNRQVMSRAILGHASDVFANNWSVDFESRCR